MESNLATHLLCCLRILKSWYASRARDVYKFDLQLSTASCLMRYSKYFPYIPTVQEEGRSLDEEARSLENLRSFLLLHICLS